MSVFYILSRFALWLVSPVSYSLALLLWAVCARSARRRVVLSVVAVASLLFFSSPIVYNGVARAWVPCESIVPDDSLFCDSVGGGRHYTYAFLPGGFSSMDSESHRIDYGESVDRLVQAVALLKRGVVDSIIISGDGAPNADAARFAMHLEEVFGVPSQRVVVEFQAVNTIQNFTLTRRLVGALALDGHVLVVNSGVYMRRSMLCAELSGWNADFLSVDFPVNRMRDINDYVLSPYVWDRWARLLHEYLGFVAYRLAYGRVDM